MELICVRHGRTAWNAARRFQGQTDIPLDDEGLAQAQALAAHLRDEHFDFALASDLNRARTTAETILAEQAGQIGEDVKELGRDYVAALETIATLRPYVDAFFDQVMIMDPDARIRHRRLRMLQRILRTFSGIADFSEIVTQG